MSVLVVGSLKASPGATTAMLALAAVWPPARPLLLVEADPDGGVLAARFGLSADPGLATLASVLRRDAGPDQLRRHAQTLPGGTPLIVGPVSPDQARVSLAGCATRLGTTLAELKADVIVDCGRLVGGSPVAPLLSAADTLLVVARPRLEELQYLVYRLPALREVVNVGVLLIGETPYGPAEVERALGPESAWVARLADDPRAAAALNGVAGGLRHLAASALVRSAREVVAQLRHLAVPANSVTSDPPHSDPRRLAAS